MEIKEYISSGILEQYVLGSLSKEESLEVEQMAAAHSEVRMELDEIEKALEQEAIANAVSPGASLKTFLMATIDYTERMENGEPVSFPPDLNETSRLIDYAEWLNRDDMFLPADAHDPYGKIISASPGTVTAILWIKGSAPKEVHDTEREKFLIVEGTCDIIIDEEIHSLATGDYFEIPLHRNHIVKVTSDIPCKLILQRIAA